MEALAALKARYSTIMDLRRASAILEWDQETYMPSGATSARADQIATLASITHEHSTAPELLDLLKTLEKQNDLGEDDRRLIQVGLRDFEIASKLPPKFVAKFASVVAHAKDAWKAARSDNAFGAFKSHLEEIVDLSKEKAQLLGYSEHPYDALLDQFEQGLTTQEVDSVFSLLRERLVPIVHQIADESLRDDSIVKRRFPKDAQWEFGMSVLKDIGYDFSCGRQDLSTHPFTTSFSITDVRITTRIDEQFFNPAFFGTLHEAGHALYEQGISRSFEKTPLADGTSLGIHESQSRMWENQIGRSRPFWHHYFPIAQTHFPHSLGDVSPDEFYRAINIVKNSTIRVEADEVTYNLHIMLRFELEKALIEGDLQVSDVPNAWNEKMHKYLGKTPESDVDGCLQDIHWSLGAIGYFPTYTLGNLMSAQLFRSLRHDIPDAEGQYRRGEFAPTLLWLRQHVHRHGRARTADEIMTQVTGESLSAESWLEYIQEKYADLYPSLNQAT